MKSYRMTIQRAAVAVSASLWAMMTATTFAADNTQDDRWRFGVTIPLWAPGIDGDVTARGRTADVDLSFDDLTDNLEASFSIGLEARRERFGFFGNVGYMAFESDERLAGGAESDAELKFLVADGGGFFRLIKTGEECPFILEALAGVRYWSVETDLKITAPGGGVLVNAEPDHHLLDPIVGLRATKYLSRKWHLDFQGDVGGFEISNDTSDLTWSASGMVSYDFTRWFTLSGGYKALALDKESGSGARERGVDIVMHGVLLAAKFSF